jgi:hypothetical protein
MALNLKVAILGRKKLEGDLRKAQARFIPELERNMGLAADIVLGDAQRRIRGSRFRALYQGRTTKGFPIPRKKPRAITAKANETGVDRSRLRQSASSEVKRRGGRAVDAEIGFGVVYAPVHEKGLRAGFGNRPMPRRPFLGPAIKAKAEAVFRILGKTFKVLD